MCTRTKALRIVFIPVWIDPSLSATPNMKDSVSIMVHLLRPNRRYYRYPNAARRM